MKIVHVVGNRPQFIKLAPFLRAAGRYRDINNIVVHSGQHYDYKMSKIFFKELGIRNVSYNLEVGSGTHGVQTGKMLARLDSVLLDEKPDIVVVYGDTNTTLAGALAAYKLHFPAAHVESGMREHIWRPEEMNKKIADHCSEYCFCPLERACDNLQKEGISKDRIYFTGDITYDSFLQNRSLALKRGNVRVPKKDFILMTMHRAETVDVFERVNGIVHAVVRSPISIIYPVHPRTRKQLQKFKLIQKLEKSASVELTDPVGYYDFIKLLVHSRMVMTDSSGVLKEAFYAQKNCVTVDDTTEYSEIFDRGYNVLAGTKTERILQKIDAMLSKEFIPLPPSENPFGDGHAADKMVSIIRKKSSLTILDFNRH